MSLPSKLLTVAEVAAILDVRVSRIYDLAKTGRIPAVRIGRQIRVDSARLSAFIAEGGRALSGGWREEAQ